MVLVLKCDKQVLGEVEQPQDDAAKVNGASDEKQDKPENVPVHIENGAEQEKPNGVAPSSGEDIEEKQEGQENDAKCNLQVEEKGKKMDGEVMENGVVNQPGRADVMHHPTSSLVSC